MTTANIHLATIGSITLATSNQPGCIRVMLTGAYDDAARAMEAATGSRFVGGHLEDFEVTLDEAIEQVCEITGITEATRA